MTTHTPSPSPLPVSLKITKGTEEHAQGYWLHLTNGNLTSAIYLQPNAGFTIKLLEQAVKEATV